MAVNNISPTTNAITSVTPDSSPLINQEPFPMGVPFSRRNQDEEEEMLSVGPVTASTPVSREGNTEVPVEENVPQNASQELSDEEYQALLEQVLSEEPEPVDDSSVEPSQDLSDEEYQSLLNEVMSSTDEEEGQPAEDMTLDMALESMTDEQFQNYLEKVGAGEVEEGDDFWTVVTDVATQTARGFRNGLINTARFIAPLYGLDPEKMAPVKEVLPEAKTEAGEVAESLSRYVTGFTFGGAPARGLGLFVQGSKAVKTLVEGGVRGFMGDMSVAGPQDETVATALKRAGADNFLVTALAVNPEDSELTRKFKVATEGVILGTTLGSLIEYGVKPLGKTVVDKVTGKSGELEEALDDAFAKSDAEWENHVPVIADDGKTIVLTAKPHAGAQAVMDDIQAAQVQEIVDKKMAVLKKRREEFEAEQELFRPMKPSESREARKEIYQSMNVAKMELKQLNNEYARLLAEFEDVTERLSNMPVPKDIIDDVKSADEFVQPADRNRRGQLIDIWRDLMGKQKRLKEQLDIVHEERLRVEDIITENQYLLRELAEDAQAAAAFRKREALRIKGPLPPKYEEVTLDDIEPLAAKKVDPASKAKAPKRIDQPLQRLNEEIIRQGRELARNEWDALVDDTIFKKRPGEVILRKMREVGSVFFSRSADSLRSLADVSPTAAKLANMIRFDTSSKAKKAGQYSFTESAQFLAGKYKAKFQDALVNNLDESYFTRSGKLTPEANKKIVRGLRGIDLDSLSTNERKAVEDIRKVLNDFWKESGEEIPTGYVENFFPRRWLPGVIHKKADEFANRLRQAGYDEDRIKEIRDHIVNEMNEDLGLVKNLYKDSGNGFEWRGSRLFSQGSRTLDIDELNFEDFLDNDAISVLSDYFDRAAKKITYNQMFGYDGKKVLEMLKAIQKESKANGRPITPEETTALRKLLQNLQGAQKIGNAFDGVNKYVGTLMRVTHLGLATLSSFGEVFIPYGRASFTQATKGLLKAVGSMPQHYLSKVFKGVPEAEAYKAAQRVNLALDAAASVRLQNLFGGELLDGVTKKINEGFFKYTLLSEWVKTIQVAAFHTGRSVISDNLTALSKGGLSASAEKRLRRELEELAVDIDLGLKWVQAGKNPNHPFMEMMDRGALRFANDAALHPDSAVKPFIQNRPEAMLLTQFKAYPIAFANVVLRDWGQGLFGRDRDLKDRIVKAARVATATGLILMATDIGQQLKSYIQYGESGNPNFENMTAEERLLHNSDVSGLLGHAAIVKHAFDADRYNQEPVHAWFGPAVGKGMNLVKAAIDEDNRQNILAKEASRMVPNFLPLELLLKMSTGEGSAVFRQQLRGWLSKPEVYYEDDLEPENVEFENITAPGIEDPRLMRIIIDMLKQDETVPKEEIEDLEKQSSAVPSIFSSAEAAEISDKEVSKVEKFKDMSPLEFLRDPLNEGYTIKPSIKLLERAIKDAKKEGKETPVGVTFGTGFDAGQWSEQSLKKIGVSEELIEKLKPVLGKKGEAALKSAKSWTPLSKEEVDTLDGLVIKHTLQELEDAFGDTWEDLSDMEKKIALSSRHQYGKRFYKQRAFKQLKSRDREALLKNLFDWQDMSPGKQGEAINERYARYGTAFLLEEVSQEGGIFVPSVRDRASERRTGALSDTSEVETTQRDIRPEISEEEVSREEKMIESLLSSERKREEGERLENLKELKTEPVMPNVHKTRKNDSEKEPSGTDVLLDIFEGQKPTNEKVLEIFGEDLKEIKKVFPDATFEEILEFLKLKKELSDVTA